MSLQCKPLECNAEFFYHYYLCHYRPKALGPDGLSQSLINFKAGWPLHVAAWRDCSAQELRKVFVAPNCVVVRALGSLEERVETGHAPLDQLGRKIASLLDGHYIPGCLSKNRTTRKVKHLSREERERELSNSYTFDHSKIPAVAHDILVVDDILTTGTTMRAIIGTIRSHLPTCRIHLFTLAYTDIQPVSNDDVRLKSYDYQWEPLQGWMVAEEPPLPYGVYERLTTKILNDTFD